MSSSNINLPQTKVWIRGDAWGNSKEEFDEAWLVSVRALRGGPLCFQVFVPRYSACYDKIPIQCLYWKLPELGVRHYRMNELQMWESISGEIEFWRKELLKECEVAIRIENKTFTKGHYWFTIDFIPEKRGLGYYDVGCSSVLEEHKEGNVIRLHNGQIAVYPNNRIKWLEASLSTEDSLYSIPPWSVAEDIKWLEEWKQIDNNLYGDGDWYY